VRYFPSASGRRLAAAAAAGAVMLGAVALPLGSPLAPASAQARDDDLEDRRDQVENRIKKAHDELEHASKQAQRAASRLSTAQRRLQGAKSELERVGHQLAAARARDAQTQAKLEAAEARLVTARADLAAGRAAAVAQRDQVTESVVTIYEQGDPQLLAFTALVNAESLEDLTTRAAAEEAIVANETQLYADLKAAEARLVRQEEEVQDATEDAEVQRRAAAVNLETTRSLVEQTRAATQRVRDLVSSSRTARQRAIAARAHDARVLRELKAREARIKQRILAEARRAQAQHQQTFNGATGGFLDYPVNGSVTSPFGYRTHPIYGYWGLHNGTDFGAGCGSSLFASANGTVTETYYDSVYGNRLYLSVGNVNGANLTLVYNHMSGYNASEGDRVARGDVVGSVGSTGWSTGCHLHFTVLRNGEPVDPMSYM
jgi:murein DD-endopeptidase MepM/ murein hydrolase activator NlpD